MIKIIQVFLWFLVIGAGAYAQEQASGGDRVGAASIGDRWGVELYSPDAGSSVVVPLYGFVSPAVKDAFAHIADEEAFPLSIYTLRPGVESYLFDRNQGTRLDRLDLNTSVVPLTPCPAGYCLPPIIFDLSGLLEGSQSPDPSFLGADLGRYLELD